MTSSELESKPQRSGGGFAGVLIAILLVALGLTGWAAFPDKVGEQIRRHILAKLQAHYSDCDVSIERARYQHGMGVVFSNIRIKTRGTGDVKTLAQIDRMVAETKIDLQRICDCDFCPDRLVLSGVELKTDVDDQGRFSIEALYPLPKFGPGADEIIVSDLSIEITQEGIGQQPIVLRDSSGRVTRDPSNHNHKEFQFQTTAGTIANRIAMTGSIDSENWSVNVKAVEASFNRRILGILPAELANRLGSVEGLSVVSNVVAKVSGTGSRVTEFHGWLSIEEGSFLSDRIPYPVTELTGNMQFNDKAIRIRELTAMIGDAHCRVTGTVTGITSPTEANLHVDVKQLLLHDRITRVALPEKFKKALDQLQPRGRISVVSDVTYGEGDWDWDGQLNCHGVDVNFEKFPYPVKQLQGLVFFKRQRTVARGLTGLLSGRKVNCNVMLEAPDLEKNNLTLAVDVQSAEPIPIDESLVAALTPRGKPQSKLERFVRSMHVSGGAVSVRNSRFEKRADGSRSKKIDLHFVNGNLKYEKFPYPIHDVQGQVIVDNDLVHVVEIQGKSNGSSLIRANGLWEKLDAGGKLQLQLNGFGIPMDQSLRIALNENHRAVWDSLGPSGVLKHLHVLINLKPGNPIPELEITARQFQPSGSVASFVSITPPAFPYQLDITRGVAHLVGDHVEIRDLEAWHRHSQLTAAGNCSRTADGRWKLSTDILPPTRLLVDDDLLDALPKEVQGTFRAMQLRGPPVNMRGIAQFTFPTVRHPNLDMNWDVQMQLEGNRIGDAGPVRDIRGELRLAGKHIGRETVASGFVRLDSLHAHDFQVAGLHGPIVIRDNRLYFGRSINHLDVNGRCGPVVGTIFGGSATSDGVVDLTNGHFDLSASFDELDFPTLLRDSGHLGEDSSGVGSCQMRLSGLVGNHRTLAGEGTAWLERASLYELPLLVRLLNVLSIQEEEFGNLSDSEFQFRIDGETLHFDDVRITGDVLVLRGVGTSNLRRELDFRFETGVSPDNIWSRFLNPLRDQKYTLWTIDVSGTLEDPILDKHALKQIEQALERLFPEFDTPVAPRVSAGRATRPSPNLRR